MADNPRDDGQSETTERDEYMEGGKGRRDEVGGSGIYPGPTPEAPADAEILTEAELARHRGPRSTPATQRGVMKTDGSSGSE